MVTFREFETKRGTRVLAGRSAENNEALVKQIGKSEDVFHTVAPGSPFVNIKGKVRFGDAKFASIVCARYSKEWKQNKNRCICT